MRIGFTGTRKGMTNYQKNEVNKILLMNSLNGDQLIFHHGGCDGADDEFHLIACKYGQVIVHPGDTKQGKKYYDNYITKLVKPYLERNKDIVNESDLLIACPKSFKEEMRSGTWATIRYAKKIGKNIMIVYPRLN